MAKIIWKDIKDYEGLYQVSNTGKIRNTKTKYILKPVTQSNGYMKVCLTKNRVQKNRTIHRLVAETFIPNTSNLPCINHKDEDKTNNQVDNLEWCDNKYNLNYGTRNERAAKSLGKKVKCVETGIIYTSINQAEKQTGINSRSISKVCKGTRYTAGGYHWKFVQHIRTAYGQI